MARISQINKATIQELSNLVKIENDYQNLLSKKRTALSLSSEYVFLSAYKQWELFLEKSFASFCRFNDPISGRKTLPYIRPKTEDHAHQIIRLEKDYIDWTSPDNVVTRAEILFRNHDIITLPIKSNMQDLRDAKKIRNFIAHGSEESKKHFTNVSFRLTGKKPKAAGDLLLDFPRNQTDHYTIHYLNIFMQLVMQISH